MATTAPAVTTIIPTVDGMPAVLGISRGEVIINTPLGPTTAQAEATLMGPSISDIRDLLAEMANPKAPVQNALSDALSWKANGRLVQILRNVAEDGSIVTAQVAASSLNEAVCILGALASHDAVQLAH